MMQQGCKRGFWLRKKDKYNEVKKRRSVSQTSVNFYIHKQVTLKDFIKHFDSI